jgi:calcineurin-like phosphoesterase family protein
MKNSWFIADTHFSHSNIIRYCKRPFTTAEEHDRVLIENWNRCVKHGDDVYFLGDFCFKSKEIAERVRKHLNGQIFFIEGNHDSAAKTIKHTFAWYQQVKMVEISGQAIWLSHYAHRVWPKAHYGAWHLYGHSHGKLPEADSGLSMDVGVDATALRSCNSLNPEGYRPVSFEEVAKIMKGKTVLRKLAEMESGDLDEEDDN